MQQNMLDEEIKLKKRRFADIEMTYFDIAPSSE